MYRNITTSLLFSVCLLSEVYAGNTCNPEVRINEKQATLSQALVSLAEQNSFHLSFPSSLDRKIAVNEVMQLDKMIKYLTHDLNTLLNYEASEICDEKKLIELVVMPTGKETEFITVRPRPVHEKRLAKKQGEGIYIEDMDAYVRDMMATNRKPEKYLMTREQIKELKAAKKRWNKNNRK